MIATTTVRRLLRIAAAVGIGGLIATAAAQPAAAAPPYTTDASIESLNFVQETVEAGQFAELAGTWSLPDYPATPAGFAVTLPAALQGKTDSFPMLDDADQPMGQCIVTETTLECDVDPAYITENPRNLHGSFNFWVKLVDAVSERTEKVFTIDDFDVSVAVVPPDGYCPTTCEYTGQDTRKFGTYLTGTSPERIEWIIDLGSGPDGMVGGEEVTITENLGANQQFTAVSMVRSNTKGLDPYTNTQIWTDWDDYTGFSHSPDFSTLEFTADAGYVYGVHYVANVLDGGAATTYFNSATVQVGSEVTTMENVPITRQGGGATGIGENVGRFAITKEVLGDATDLPAQDFSGSYTVTAPDGTETPGTFTVQGGATWTSADFPRGSTVHLSEVVPTTPANIAWGAPSFSQNDFTLVGGTLTSVTLTNEATVRTGVFEASKQLTGTDEAIGLVPDSATFALDYAYDAGVGFAAGSGTLTLDRDGTVATSDPLPVGAVLRLSEAAPAAVDGAAWGDATITPSTVTITEGSPAASVVVTNPVRETTGGFSVVKRVTGSGAGHVADGTPFTVAYEWATPDGTRSDSGELNLTVGGDPVSVEGLPEGAVVHLSEVTPSPVEGVTWLDPIFSTNGFTVQGGTLVEVDLDNATALTTGTFEVRKVLAGSGAALVPDSTPFTVDYSYEAGTGFEAGSGRLTVLADGETVTSDPLPYGAVVTLSEIEPAAVDGTLWTGASFSTSTFTVGSGTTVSITLTNTVELRTGAFSIVKALAGSGADLVLPETGFTVHYVYEAGPGFEAGSGELTVRADGAAVTSEPLPFGAVVTLIESEPGAVDGATWTDAAFSASTVTIGADTVVAVTLTNTIESVPPGTTTPPSTTTPPNGTTPPGLAQTGGLLDGTLIAIALSVLAGGALVLAVGRRRRDRL